MQYSAVVFGLLISGCSLAVEPAPIQFKETPLAGQKFDGVSLSVLCELAERVGTDYRAADIEDEEAAALQRQSGQLYLLNIDGATCAKRAQPINLAFVADPERKLVSTWGGMQQDGYEDVWGSCLADTDRSVGDRVVFCEVGYGAGQSAESLAYNPGPAG